MFSKKVLGLALAVLLAGTAVAGQMVVRVYATGYWQLYDRVPFKGTSIQIAGAVPGESYDLMLDRADLGVVMSCGLPAEVIIDDTDTRRLEAGEFGQYNSYDTLKAMMRNWASTYPSICKLDSFGPTHEGRWVLGVKISDNPNVDEDEPEVMFMGQLHAREWAAGQVCRHFADTLLTNYASNSSFRDLVDGHEIWVFPIVNVDGFVYDYPSQRSWRKNRQPFGSSTGCDDNRDFNGVCNGNRMADWGALVSGSRTTHLPSDETFFGASGGWGREVGHLCDFFRQRTFVAVLEYHSYSELVLWPYGHGEQTADNNYYVNLGTQIASRINKLSSGTYTPQQANRLYPTNGGSDDWFYGWARTIGGFPCMSFCVELGTSFYQSTSQLDNIETQAFKGAFYLAQQSDNIIATLEGTVPRPILAPMDSSNTGSFTLHWTPIRPEHNHPTKWELEELTGLTVVEDSLESGTGKWVLQGASQSTTQKHSGSYSIFFGSANNISNYMVTADPYLVQAGDSVKYWIWYDTESNYDVVTTEVSLEGKEWFQLHDRFTGSSSGWVRKAYSLAPWAGKSVFIRFRYMTDDGTLRSGAYVDDVWPAPQFANRTVISDNITDTLYAVSGKTPARYYYRVRGSNAAWGWGDKGPLEDVLVTGSGVAENPVVPVTRIAGITPNPTAGSAVIHFTLGRSGRASIAVYDAAGTLVRTLAAGRGPSAVNSLVWDGRDAAGREVPAGVYYVRLTADNIATARIAVVR